MPVQTRSAVRGVESAQNPTRISFRKKSISLTLANYDFVSCSFGEETDGDILLEFKHHRIIIQGKNLAKIYEMIESDTLKSIQEVDSKKGSENDSFAETITVEIRDPDNLTEETKDPEEL